MPLLDKAKQIIVGRAVCTVDILYIHININLFIFNINVFIFNI